MSTRDYWLFKRSGGRWVFAWAPDANDKKKRKQTLLPANIHTQREAETYAGLHTAELKAPSSPTVQRARPIAVGDLVERWVTLRENDERFAAATFKDARTCLRHYVAKPVDRGPDLAQKDRVVDIGSMRADHLDVPVLRKWVRALSDVKGERSGRPLAPYTIRNILRALTWFLDDVIGEGWAALPGGQNPARQPAVHTELPEMVPLAGKSQKLRLAAAPDAQRLLDCERVPMERRVRYVVGLTAGLRDGEIAGLKLKDVDLDAGIVWVRYALQLQGRRGYATLGKTKTTASVRAVPLHVAAVEALKEWLSLGWEVHVGHAPRPEDPVFPNASGAAYRPRSADRFRNDASAAGLPTAVDGHPLTFHALRRTFATWLRAAGVPQEARQVLMGHVPRTAEERHYSEENPAALAEFVGRIPLVWRSAARRACA
jgi:integrase